MSGQTLAHRFINPEYSGENTDKVDKEDKAEKFLKLPYLDQSRNL